MSDHYLDEYTYIENLTRDSYGFRVQTEDRFYRIDKDSQVAFAIENPEYANGARVDLRIAKTGANSHDRIVGVRTRSGEHRAGDIEPLN